MLTVEPNGESIITMFSMRVACYNRNVMTVLLRFAMTCLSRSAAEAGAVSAKTAVNTPPAPNLNQFNLHRAVIMVCP